jgi:hypothetical protein
MRFTKSVMSSSVGREALLRSPNEFGLIKGMR